MKTTQFFCSAPYKPGQAFINWAGDPVRELAAYAESYRAAACRLVYAHEERKHGSLDLHALPILYLYRHSFELVLKAIVYRSAILSISKQELLLALPRLWREHSLVRLLEMALPALQPTRISCGDIEELVEKMSFLAQQIDAIDPGSYAFRYPVTSSGAPSLPPNFLTNIFEFSEAAESVIEDASAFCKDLAREGIVATAQMKLSLHALLSKAPSNTSA